MICEFLKTLDFATLLLLRIRVLLCVAHAGHVLQMIFLPNLPKYWGSRHALLCLVTLGVLNLCVFPSTHYSMVLSLWQVLSSFFPVFNRTHPGTQISQKCVCFVVKTDRLICLLFAGPALEQPRTPQERCVWTLRGRVVPSVLSLASLLLWESLESTEAVPQFAQQYWCLGSQS